MPISIAATSLLPLGDQPTRISVRVNPDLFKSIDPSMDLLVEGDSFSRVNRKGRAAIDQLSREVSTALFGAEVPRLRIGLGFPKHREGPVGPGPNFGYYIGICFEQHVTAEDISPRVLELTAVEEVDGTIVFHAAEANAEMRDHVNKEVGMIDKE
ncbi:hypothetical protein VM1G_11245 [Cytospora mali]|uniref:Uncharacterized protein n=1 Tax=Cytospora mali TaxID=578113 RepID=A0A194VKQ5_CYTMA|nr:hypothetical protein VM1G_11245 [Valsa mali]